MNIKNNQFITKDTYLPTQTGDIDNTAKFHYIDFEIPIYLKDISIFFRKIDMLKFAEFNITLKFIDDMIISSRENIKLI